MATLKEIVEVGKPIRQSSGGWLAPYRGGERRPSISELRLDKLLYELGEKEIVVDQSSSEQRVGYSLAQGKRRGSYVPLGTTFPCDVNVWGYVLRCDNGITLKLSNYESSGSGGIQCKIKQDADPVDPGLGEKVRLALHKAYYYKMDEELAEKMPQIMAAIEAEKSGDEGE